MKRPTIEARKEIVDQVVDMIVSVAQERDEALSAKRGEEVRTEPVPDLEREERLADDLADDIVEDERSIGCDWPDDDWFVREFGWLDDVEAAYQARYADERQDPQWVEAWLAGRTS